MGGYRARLITRDRPLPIVPWPGWSNPQIHNKKYKYDIQISIQNQKHHGVPAVEEKKPVFRPRVPHVKVLENSSFEIEKIKFIKLNEGFDIGTRLSLCTVYV